jgi:drug/metabolite transporter (DMT)-like permease
MSEKDAANRLKSFAAAVQYGAVSVAIVLFNKAFLSSFSEGSFPFTLALAQSCAGIVVFWLLSALRIISVQPLSYEMLRRMFSLSAVNALNVALSFVCLQFTTVPTYGALRRLALLCTMLADYLLFNKTFTRSTVASVLTMVAGGLLMGVTDLEFSMLGYAAGIGSAFLQGLFLVLSKRFFDEKKLSAFDSSYLYCVASTPYYVVFWIYSNEMASMPPGIWANQMFVVCFAASVLLGVALIFSTQYCNIVNTPLTVSATGQVKSVIQAVTGVIVFRTRHPPLNMLGIVIGFLGSSWYAQIKYLESANR